MSEWVFEKQGNVGVVHLKGRLDAANEKSFKEAFREWMKETNRFVLDLDAMDFMDSTGLGALLSCLKYVGESRGEIKIARIQQGPRIVFEITRASKIFDLFDDVASAVDSFPD